MEYYFCCIDAPNSHHTTRLTVPPESGPSLWGRTPSPRTCVHSQDTQDFKETSLKSFSVISFGTLSLSCKCHSCTPHFLWKYSQKVIQQTPQFPSWSWACWLNITVPISLQIWGCSLQTLSLAYPIKLSNTLIGHNKNLPLK